MTQIKINSSINLNRNNNSDNDCGSPDSAESPKRLVIDERLEVNDKQNSNENPAFHLDFSEVSKGNEENMEVQSKPNLNENCSKYGLNFGSPDSSEKALVENLEMKNNQNTIHESSKDVSKSGNRLYFN